MPTEPFAPPASALIIPNLGPLGTAPLPSSGQGVALGPTGKLPLSVLPRMITGNVTSAGAVSVGTGYSVSFGGAGSGTYTITYTLPFDAVPIVMVTPQSAGGPAFRLTSQSATGFTVNIYTSSTLANLDSSFNFVAVLAL